MLGRHYQPNHLDFRLSEAADKIFYRFTVLRVHFGPQSCFLFHLSRMFLRIFYWKVKKRKHSFINTLEKIDNRHQSMKVQKTGVLIKI